MAAALAGLALLALAFAVVPPVARNPAYHAFAGRRTLFGVPNFWNVATNALFLLVALYGVQAPGARVRIRGSTCSGRALFAWMHAVARRRPRFSSGARAVTIGA